MKSCRISDCAHISAKSMKFILIHVTSSMTTPLWAFLATFGFIIRHFQQWKRSLLYEIYSETLFNESLNNVSMPLIIFICNGFSRICVIWCCITLMNHFLTLIRKSLIELQIEPPFLTHYLRSPWVWPYYSYLP